MGFREAGIAFDKERRMEELATIVDQSPNLSSIELLRMAAKKGLIDNPNMVAILQHKLKEESTNKALQLQQQGVNLRQDMFGSLQPDPDQQAQQDIQNITDGAQPSIMNNLNPQSDVEIGNAAINLTGAGQGTGLQQPEQLNNIMERLRVDPPIQMQEEPARRQEAIDAGLSGDELDGMLSDLRSGNIGLSDFDDKIARAKTSQAKKMQAERKLEDEKIESARRRLQQNITKVPIYLDGKQVSRIDQNRDPRDYEIGTTQIIPPKKVTVYRREGGYKGGDTGAKESGRTLRKLYGERTKLQTQINNLQAKIDLNPKLLEVEGLDKKSINRQIRNMLDMVDDINDNINNLSQKQPTKNVRKRTLPRSEIIAKLREYGKDDKSIDQYLRLKGFKGLGDAISGSNVRMD